MDYGPSHAQGQDYHQRTNGAGVASAYAGARRTAPATTCTTIANLPIEALSQAEKDALVETLQEEYLARDVCTAVIAKLGSVRPFTSIVKSEEQHVAALTALFTKYQLAFLPTHRLHAPAP